jgi:hypothetical protein
MSCMCDREPTTKTKRRTRKNQAFDPVKNRTDSNSWHPAWIKPAKTKIWTELRTRTPAVTICVRALLRVRSPREKPDVFSGGKSSGGKKIFHCWKRWRGRRKTEWQQGLRPAGENSAAKISALVQRWSSARTELSTEKSPREKSSGGNEGSWSDSTRMKTKKELLRSAQERNQRGEQKRYKKTGFSSEIQQDYNWSTHVTTISPFYI